MPLYVNNSGAQRCIGNTAVRDGGSWQPLKEGWVRVSGTWQKFYAAYQGSMLAGQISHFGTLYTGYNVPQSIGTLSPVSDQNGNTINGVFDASAGGGPFLYWQISITSDPGAAYFDSLTINKTTTYKFSAAAYSYGSGIAMWSWAGGYGFVSGNTYQISVTS